MKNCQNNLFLKKSKYLEVKFEVHKSYTKQTFLRELTK